MEGCDALRERGLRLRVCGIIRCLRSLGMFDLS